MKKIIFNLLCHQWLGQLIYLIFNGNIPDLRWGGRHKMPANIAPRLYASVFWGFYESAEKRLINRYLPGHLPVIELGGSLGIVSSHIARKLDPRQIHLIVEMNSNLIPFTEQNAKSRTSHPVQITIINQPICYESASVWVSLSHNTTESKVDSTDNHFQSIQMPATTLTKLHQQIGSGPFALVCDIEGMEIQVLKNDYNSLQYCQHLIIELHNTTYQDQFYDVEALVHLLQHEYGLTKVEQDGHVFYFNRTAA